jgi:TniQ
MRLVVTPKPETGESPVGYFLRLTQRNGYETPTVILQLAGLGIYALQYCQFVFGGRWDLSALARLTGAALSTLAPLRYDAAASEGYVRRFLVFGSPVRRYFINTTQPKVCPDCLRERGCCLKIWELIPITACPRHRRMLLDECPGCRERITWFRNEVSRCPCGCDWREASPSPVGDPDLHAVRRIHRLCGLSSEEDFVGAGADVTPVDGLDLEHYLYALSFVAGQHSGVIDTKGKLFAKGRRNAELHDLFAKAASVLERWPASFESFLDWRRTLPSEGDARTGLHKDFGTFYPGLYFNLSQPAFDFMRRAFENYVARRWSGGYAGVIRRRKGAVLDERRYASKTEARNRLRVDAAYLDGLIKAGKLEAVVRTRGKKRMYLIDLASLERLEIELRKSLTCGEVAEVLNVGPMVIADLVSYGCLTPHRGPSIDGLRCWRFTRGAADELIGRLESRVSREPAPPAANRIGFSKALSALSRRGYSLAIFVRAVLEGEIIPCGKGGGRGVKSLIFRREDVRSLRPVDVPA